MSDPGAASAGDAPALDVSLPNGGAGPDPFVLSERDATLAVLLFHRDYFCGNCRRQAVEVGRRYEAFRERDAVVVSILPEPRDRAAAWAERRESPFPVLADPDSEVAERYGQPVGFGPLGRRIDLLGRKPLAALVDLREEPELLWRYAGDTADDRPSVDELLAELDKFL